MALELELLLVVGNHLRDCFLAYGTSATSSDAVQCPLPSPFRTSAFGPLTSDTDPKRTCVPGQQSYLVGRPRPIASHAALTKGVATTVHAKAMAG